MLEMIMKPDASKQYESDDILDYQGNDYSGLCWNCELAFKSLEDAPADLPLCFCSPLCKQDWVTRQPLQNLLDKRSRRSLIMSADIGKSSPSGGRAVTDNDKFRQGRVAQLTNSILAILAGANSAEADTALTLAVIASVYWRTSDAATRLQVVDEFTRQVRELVQREDVIKQVEASITWTLRA
jgi:hypothetical protein